MKKLGLAALLIALLAHVALAAPLFVRPVQDLSFGEGLLNTPASPGSVSINAANGAVALNNLTMIVAPSAGTVTLEGEDNVPIVLTVSAAAAACDTTYMGACSGTPDITVTHNSPGYIPSGNCTRKFRCTDTVTVGGTFTFPAAAEGRWTSVITITVNYQ